MMVYPLSCSLFIIVVYLKSSVQQCVSLESYYITRQIFLAHNPYLCAQLTSAKSMATDAAV